MGNGSRILLLSFPNNFFAQFYWSLAAVFWQWPPALQWNWNKCDFVAGKWRMTRIGPVIIFNCQPKCLRRIACVGEGPQQVGRPRHGPVALTVRILDGLAVSLAPEVFHAGQVSGPSATLDCCGLFPGQVPVVVVAQADRLDTEHV